MSSHTLSHVDAEGRPRMVDVGAKAVTRREACAEASVVFPAEVAESLRAQAMRSAKGAVLDTAVVAGTLAVKRTHELVPFCHPLPVEKIGFECDWMDAVRLRLRCTVAAVAKTGVEMEALVGVQIAAATVYDMCKALSHAIRIEDVVVVAKSGGRDNFDHRGAD
ncbi:MAG: cyclic pyranopterin monophosphate synthase MoaC [Xanthomonadales bacterium]|nr:cyclic pyranopterin monophosphate synthase MoaC [Xanthomonadales bacterium]MBP6078018.1 cyclic pyranopterin monophosphate synthase MoaC [Xanthomonadales bacterium]MBP7623287.1 cyclic pyranopterin monophosphate synthase MoaC [Xanthomonadales bacterium]